jgi:hypothetical protein
MYTSGFMGGYVDPASREVSGGFILGGNASTKVVLGLDYVVDPTLPIVGRHPVDHEGIVIPKGTLCKIDTAALVNSPATVSIANDGDVAAGVAPMDYKRQRQFDLPWEFRAPIRDSYIAMPYVAAFNGTTMVAGDLVKAGDGGKFVKWTHSTDDVKLAIGRLEYIDKRAGATPGFLKWVRTEFGEWGPYGLQFPVVSTKRIAADGDAYAASATTATFGQTPASSLRCDLSRKVFQLSQKQLNLAGGPVDVVVGGVTFEKDAIGSVHGFGDGYAYLVDLAEGKVIFTQSIPTTATVQVSYSYVEDYYVGGPEMPGILGLTDGAQSGLGVGVPPWFDVPGSIGKMVIRLA